jgi:transposase
MLEHVFHGSLFTSDFLTQSIVDGAEWKIIDVAELDALAADLRVIFEAFPVAQTPNETRTEDDLIWPVLKRLGWQQAMRGGTLAFDLRHKTASTRADNTGCCDQTHGNCHQDCAFLRAILRGGRIANAFHQLRKDDPGHCLQIVMEARMSRLFWLSDEAWAAIEPHLPKNQPGARRVDDRRVISGILHVLKTGCRWKDCPAKYGPPTTIYNGFNRWSRRRLWTRILDALVAKGVLALSVSVDSSYVKAHRSAHGGKGDEGAGHRSLARRPDHQDPCGD